MKNSHVLLLLGLVALLTGSVVACSPPLPKSQSAAPSPTPTPNLDNTPPIISGVLALQISDTGAVITWITNEPATSQVEYGETSEYGLNTPVDETRAASHRIMLSNLMPDITYHYRVTSRDSSGNLAISSDFTFTTLLLPNAEDKDRYATIIKLVDSKGNCELHSHCNGRRPTYTGDALYRPAKVGETITLKVDVYNAVADPVLYKYQFTGTGFISDWQVWRPDNKITMTVTERAQTFRCRVYVKNSDERYRTADIDDMIELYYKLVP